MAKYTTQFLKPYRGWRNGYQDFDDPAKALFFARRHSMDIRRVVRVIDGETGEVLVSASPAKWEAWQLKIKRADLYDAKEAARNIDLDKPNGGLPVRSVSFKLDPPIEVDQVVSQRVIQPPPPQSSELCRSAEAGRGRTVSRG